LPKETSCRPRKPTNEALRRRKLVAEARPRPREERPVEIRGGHKALGNREVSLEVTAGIVRITPGAQRGADAGSS